VPLPNAGVATATGARGFLGARLAAGFLGAAFLAAGFLAALFGAAFFTAFLAVLFAAGFRAVDFLAAGFRAAFFGAFLAIFLTAFLAAGFFAVAFFAARFLAGDFFAADLLAAGFFAAVLRAAAFFAGAFLAAGFLTAFFGAAFFAAGLLAAAFLAGFFAFASAINVSSWYGPPLRTFLHPPPVHHRRQPLARMQTSSATARAWRIVCTYANRAQQFTQHFGKFSGAKLQRMQQLGAKREDKEFGQGGNCSREKSSAIDSRVRISRHVAPSIITSAARGRVL